MRVAVTSGRLAGPLADGLAEAGHDVVRLVEREASGPGERHWDPAAGRIDNPGLSDVDAVANLFEADVWRRWTPEVRDEIRGSQVTGTLTIVSHLEPDGRCQRYANLSATSFHGDRGEVVLDADSGVGRGWLAQSTAAWEAAARHAPVRGRRDERHRPRPGPRAVAADGKALAYDVLRADQARALAPRGLWGARCRTPHARAASAATAPGRTARQGRSCSTTVRRCRNRSEWRVARHARSRSSTARS